MRSIRVRELLSLFIGDVAFLVAALWLTLAIRYFNIPSTELFMLHFVPFSLLFIVWILLFFIVGLYEQHTLIFRMRLPGRIFRAQTINVIIAGLFFFFVDIFGIAPKTNLLIYLLVSFVLIVWWRLWVYPRLSTNSNRAPALLVGGGSETKELFNEVNGNNRYPYYFVETLSIDHLDGGSVADKLYSAMKRPDLSFVVADVHHRKLANILPHLYKPIFSDVRFVDARELYEEIFERLPLSFLGDSSIEEFLGHHDARWTYMIIKRLIDIMGGIAMGLVTMLVAPFVWIALRIEGKGPLFIVQERMGINSTRVQSYKFRSMSFNDAASAEWVGEGKTANKVTRVGSVLRVTSIDEFPQFINILAGELSLIGPRNDIVGLGERLAEAIPFYKLRYSVKPGITGWAQINQQYEQGNISPQSIEETKVRLAYDFYYIKNRSLMLDIIIALKTLKRMVFRLSSW